MLLDYVHNKVIAPSLTTPGSPFSRGRSFFNGCVNLALILFITPSGTVHPCPGTPVQKVITAVTPLRATEKIVG